MKRITIRAAGLLAAVLLPLACGGEPASDAEASEGETPPPAGSTLSEVELEQGIGPIRDLELGPIDPELVAEGETIFRTKCSACHKLDERYVAPALGEVLSRRRPEFVMNMTLNAGEMVQRHPVVKELLAEFYTPMPAQLSDPEQARAVLEYLRSVQTGDPSTPQ